MPGLGEGEIRITQGKCIAVRHMLGIEAYIKKRNENERNDKV